MEFRRLHIRIIMKSLQIIRNINHIYSVTWFIHLLLLQYESPYLSTSKALMALIILTTVFTMERISSDNEKQKTSNHPAASEL